MEWGNVSLRVNDAVWSERVQQCRTSGLTDHIWCKENGIAFSTFYYHVRKLGENACKVSAPKRRTAMKSTK